VSSLTFVKVLNIIEKIKKKKSAIHNTLTVFWGGIDSFDKRLHFLTVVLGTIIFTFVVGDSFQF